jgi:hypothetical protein
MAKPARMTPRGHAPEENPALRLAAVGQLRLVLDLTRGDIDHQFA